MTRMFRGSPLASAWQTLQAPLQESLISKVWWLVTGLWQEVHWVPPMCDSAPT